MSKFKLAAIVIGTFLIADALASFRVNLAHYIARGEEEPLQAALRTCAFGKIRPINE